jgi:hypothetical protein
MIVQIQILNDLEGNNHDIIQVFIYSFHSLVFRQVHSLFQAVPWLRRLVAGLSPRRPRFDPGPVHVGFVVDKVALGQVFPPVLRFSPVDQGCGASVASAAGAFTKKKKPLPKRVLQSVI